MYGIYDSYKTGHIWSMGTAYLIPEDGSNFGTLYGLAYKHTNNATGGTMAGGHQMVWVVNGTGTAALGTGIWTSGTGVFGGTVTVATPTGGSHAVTKSYVDGIAIPGGRTSGDTGTGYLLYAGTTATAGRLDGGTTAPSGTTRLNYGGYLYATQLYDGGTRVAISTRSITPLAGGGLSGGGNLTADRTLAVDSTVIRTTGNQSMAGIKNFTGSVGIGVAAPIEKLEVNGNVVANAYYYTSDIRLKENISNVENSLSKILQLQGISYNLKEKEDRKMGFSAQELQKIYPELVKEGSDGYLSIDGTGLIAPLVEAIKEQQREINELKKKVEELSKN